MIRAIAKALELQNFEKIRVEEFSTMFNFLLINQGWQNYFKLNKSSYYINVKIYKEYFVYFTFTLLFT